eukprot:CAMPEP_0114548806 /NCGR_PEP_ID=MMETSP0114-20121206/5184_1 /TAXON_ID=31324 /ORGANISM="Goniomonas sp, Strain m" /LENGTH=112 /DNA_ID=CAMNT_0001733433 /DNA_START=158 /DNA_END=496 /DNA_ORIENTATION=+
MEIAEGCAEFSGAIFSPTNSTDCMRVAVEPMGKLCSDWSAKVSSCGSGGAFKTTLLIMDTAKFTHCMPIPVSPDGVMPPARSIVCSSASSIGRTSAVLIIPLLVVATLGLWF